MSNEISPLKENDTYEFSHIPQDRTIIGDGWIYAMKLGPNNKEYFKARYVAKG